MIFRRLIIIVFPLLLVLHSELNAQARYWIFFSDKCVAKGDRPALSERALARRARMLIPIDEKDYPVNPAYLAALRDLGIVPEVTTRWLNGAAASLNPAQLVQLQQLPFVRALAPVGRSMTAETRQCSPDPEADLNTARIQLSMLDLDQLHAHGYTGKGVLIALMDNGYRNVNLQPGLAHVFARNGVVATRDYVERRTDVYGPCRGGCGHGANVWSVIAARIEGELTGAAPDADFILIRSENDTSETHQEEHYWMAGAEWADSLGADIITSSLGYRFFDPGEGDYELEDLNGDIAIVTRAADIAAAKGILVVNSAGNEGQRGLIAPADGDSVLAVGAVDQSRTIAGFSSAGPRTDGRIKPEVLAMGSATWLMNLSGNVTRGSGTSFSCPLITGLAACLMQAAPQAGNMDVFQAIVQSAEWYENPDPKHGYGIPDGCRAYTALTGRHLISREARSNLLPGDLAVMPIPGSRQLAVAYYHGGEGFAGFVEMLDMTGRRIAQQRLDFRPGLNQVETAGNTAPGVYVVRIYSADGRWRAAKKVLLKP